MAHNEENNQSIKKQNYRDNIDRISRQVFVVRSHVKSFSVLENEVRYFLEKSPN